MFPFPQKTQTRNLVMLFSRRLDFSLSAHSVVKLCSSCLHDVSGKCHFSVNPPSTAGLSHPGISPSHPEGIHLGEQI